MDTAHILQVLQALTQLSPTERLTVIEEALQQLR